VRLVVHPGGALSGEFEPPGDKSITHRALILGLLSSRPLEVLGANPGLDCAATAAAAQLLGAEVTATRIAGPAQLREPPRAIDCGNSGTTLRLLAGVLAAQPFPSVLTGDASLRSRPMARIMAPLLAMGARLHAQDGGLAPITVQGAPLTAIDWTCPVASAQVESCVLLAATFAKGRTSVSLPGPARDHSLRMLGAFGAQVEVEPLAGGGRRASLLGPVRLAGPTRLRVPGDFSSAAFFLAAAATGGEVTARGVGLNPTRDGLLEVLERMGAEVVREDLGEESGEPVGDVTVRGRAALSGVDVPSGWIPRLIDEVPALAVAAAFARGRTRLTGAGELRHKESDRIATLVQGLRGLGIEAAELPDGLEITGGRPTGGRVDARGDHRIAMAFATLATRASGPVTIDDASSIVTSYPGFIAELSRLGGRIEAVAAA